METCRFDDFLTGDRELALFCRFIAIDEFYPTSRVYRRLYTILGPVTLTISAAWSPYEAGGGSITVKIIPGEGHKVSP